MRFLIASVLIVATVIALATLFNTFRQTASEMGTVPTTMPLTTTATPSPTTNRLILTPILSPTPTLEEISLVEKWEKLGDQDFVYFVPQNVSPGQVLGLVIYSHGSTEEVIESQKDAEEVQKLRKYAEVLTKKGFILAASNLQGENWGSVESVEEIEKLVAYFKERYALQEKINLWGFSMGALPVMGFATKNSEEVAKIALFAPSVNLEDFPSEKISAISAIPIKIWHGDNDQNVPYQQSQDFLQKLLFGGVPVEFETAAGAGHFDLEDTKGLVEFLER